MRAKAGVSKDEGGPIPRIKPKRRLFERRRGVYRRAGRSTNALTMLLRIRPGEVFSSQRAKPSLLSGRAKIARLVAAEF